jgi:cytochrome c
MWSTKTNNIIAAIIAAVWVLLGSNYIGNILIPPFEPVQVAKGSKVPVLKKATKAAEPEQSLRVLLASKSAKEGKKVAKKCVSCHSFSKGGKNKVGPNLYNILGQNRAAAPGFNYSVAIKKMGGKWSFTDMDKFLANPKSFIPGTKMAFKGLKSASDRAAVILYIRSFSDTPLALPK